MQGPSKVNFFATVGVGHFTDQMPFAQLADPRTEHCKNSLTESNTKYEPIIILHVVKICFHHCIILCPGRISIVVALHKMQRNINGLCAQLCDNFFKSPIHGDHILLTTERRIVHIES